MTCGFYHKWFQVPKLITDPEDGEIKEIKIYCTKCEDYVEDLIEYSFK